jgi:hypothetical protein
MLKLVSTPYVTLCADDDFIAYEGLLECVNFLSANDDYSAVQGLYLGFQEETFPKYWLWGYRYGTKYAFEQSAVTDRVIHAIQVTPVPYCYSVMKTQVMSNCWRLMDGVEDLSVATFEFSFIPGVMLQGKYKTLPVFFRARQLSAITRWRDEKLFYTWYEEQSPKGFVRWKNNVLEMYTNISGLPKENLENPMDISLKNLYLYIKERQHNAFLREKTVSFKSRIRDVVLPFLYFTLSIRDTFSASKIFEYEYYSKFLRDWSRIKKFIF